MALFNWSERFMLGIPEIDQQHKMIVYLINQLNESREAGRCDDNADEVLSKSVEKIKKAAYPFKN